MKEQDAKVLIKTVIKALIHCHSNGIIHRDIKLENIMFNTNEITDFSDIQIIDFGLSKKLDNSFGLLSTIVGSPYFTAPEVFEGNYGKECDVWS
jgi:calcium-dependent protein kinase